MKIWNNDLSYQLRIDFLNFKWKIESYMKTSTELFMTPLILAHQSEKGHLKCFSMMHQKQNLYYALVVRFVGLVVVMVGASVIGIFCASFDDCFFTFLNVSALPTEGLKVIENGFDKVLSFSFVVEEEEVVIWLWNIKFLCFPFLSYLISYQK